MNSDQVRQKFLKYFESKGHLIEPSAPIIPQGDSTLYFVNAGMVPYKDYFIGRKTPPSKRITTSQRCMRVSGKHNDLDEVGRTPRHHTFFEMLGNFSFGDYFKQEAISMAWELLTEVWKIDAERLWITVFETDDEALEIWKNIGVPEARIQRLGAKDNFWTMGDTGPCGPCSEIHYDLGESMDPGNLGGPATESDRYMEIWNNVFMQYEVKKKQGPQLALPNPSIDTGMGLERITAVIQGVTNNYDTDLFQPLIAHASKLSGHKYGEDQEIDMALRVLADHARATTFLMFDGVRPDNEGRNYVLRRVMRRALRFAWKLGVEKPFLNELCNTVINQYQHSVPLLKSRTDVIRDQVLAEEKRFQATLKRGLTLLDTELDSSKEGTLSGTVAFKLYDTFGFPFDLTQLIAEEREIKVDKEGFDTEMSVQKERGKKGWKGSGEQGGGELWAQVAKEHGGTAFTGYDHSVGSSKILAILPAGAQELSPTVSSGEAIVVVRQTPLYAESGGQMGDSGTLDGVEVKDCTKVSGLHLHHLTNIDHTLSVGDDVALLVNTTAQNNTRRNHTSTHLLHSALRNIVGTHVAQRGSLVGPNRLRFDFSHHQPLTAEEIERIEEQVNTEILKNKPLQTKLKSLDEAMADGAMALFGEKYEQDVRVVSIEGFSVELCGGTHVRNTGDIGLFRITSEGGIASGVRRIEAQTGLGALAAVNKERATIAAVCKQLKTSGAQLPTAVTKLQEEHRRLLSELKAMKKVAAKAAAGDLAGNATTFGSVKVIAARFDGDLKDQADRLRDELGSAVVVLAAQRGEKVQVLVAATKDLTKTVHAGKWIKELAPFVDGRGGGRPDLAQAGGKNPAGIDKLLSAALEMASVAFGQ